MWKKENNEINQENMHNIVTKDCNKNTCVSAWCKIQAELKYEQHVDK